jgi:hypothetical protein
MEMIDMLDKMWRPGNARNAIDTVFKDLTFLSSSMLSILFYFLFYKQK